ncbi:tetratricopeptide repeat protein [Thermodesulfatator atlanticus]
MMKLLPTKIEKERARLLKALEELETPFIYAFPRGLGKDALKVMHLVYTSLRRGGQNVLLIDEDYSIPLESDAEVLLVFGFLRYPEILRFLEAKGLKKVILAENEDLLSESLFSYPIIRLQAEEEKAHILQSPDQVCDLVGFFSRFGLLLPFSIAARILKADEDDFGALVEELAAKGFLSLTESLSPPGLYLESNENFKLPSLSLQDVLDAFDPEEPLERSFMAKFFESFFSYPLLKKLLFPEGSWSELRTLFEETLERVKPFFNSPWEFLSWAEGLKAARLFERSFKLLKEGEQKFKGMELFTLSLAEVLGELGVREKKYAHQMRTIFQRLRRQKTGNAYIYLKWAGAEKKLRNFELAEELLESLREVSSLPMVYALYIDLALEAMHLKKAEKLLSEALERFYENIFFLHLKARLHLIKGELEECFRVLSFLKHEVPANAYVFSTEAEAFLAKDLPEKALEVLDKALSRWPDHPVLMHQYARAEIELKRPEKAIEVLEELKEYDPVEPRHWLELSRACFLAREYEKSLSIASQALEQFVYRIPFMHRKAEALIALEKYEEAEKVLKAILKEEPLNPFALCSYARLKLLRAEDASYYLEALKVALKEKKLDFLRYKRLKNYLEILKSWHGEST